MKKNLTFRKLVLEEVPINQGKGVGLYVGSNLQSNEEKVEFLENALEILNGKKNNIPIIHGNIRPVRNEDLKDL